METKNKILTLIMFMTIINSCSRSITEEKIEIPKNDIWIKQEDSNEKKELLTVWNEENEKKLKIDSRCTWCWRCVISDAEHFKMNLKNFTPDILSQSNLESESLKNAIKNCPVNAISIS